MNIDILELEKYLDNVITKPGNENIEWQLKDVTKDEFIDFIMGEFGQCLEKLTNQMQAQNVINAIRSYIYYYQYGYENKLLERIKRKNVRSKETIQKKVKHVLELLQNENINSESDQYQLKTLLDDMYQNPYKYVTPDDNTQAEVAQLDKSMLIDNIINTFSPTFRKKKCVNTIKRAIKKLPFTSD